MLRPKFASTSTEGEGFFSPVEGDFGICRGFS
jgi:hypothetical protein